ncbi:sulfatase [Lentisphaera marina]|uniref:sulfatase n=1 Tax=Lentisphaera marina TaxID=1111041 RepID=UPI002365157B|nr:sulfatase [Lentisphaera marina]MDD7987452.1 sulfatase [Lentisphaera marina]
MRCFLLLVFLLLDLRAEKPNVLLIMVDDLAEGVERYYAEPAKVMPNLDRLKEQGMTFTNAWCQAPLCGPSRASMMTGLYPTTTGIYGHIKDDDIKSDIGKPKLKFLPEYFSDQGYLTMGVGKIFHRGAAKGAFQEYGGMPGNGSTCFGPAPKYRMIWPESGEKGKGTLTDWGPYLTDEDQPDTRAARWAVERLSKGYDKPFFMAVGFVKPHVPWHVSKKWFDKFELDKIIPPKFSQAELKDVPQAAKKVHDVPAYPTYEWALKNNQLRPMLQSYLACSAFVDDCIGQVLDALEASPHKDNTIVLLASDHGYHLGEKNRIAKMSLWERSARVPLIIAGAGVKRNMQSKLDVGLIDVYPTLVDYCDLPANSANEGKSFSAHLSDPQYTENNYVLTCLSPRDFAVSSGRWRYYRYHDGSEELYDLYKDSRELKNLALNPESLSIRKKLALRIPQNPAKAISKMHHNPHFKKTK